MTDVLRYPEPVHRYRFLLSDGRTVDVEATRDDNHLRAWVLDQMGATQTGDLRIAGSAELPAAPTLFEEAS